MHLDWYKMYLLLVSLFAMANGQFLESPTNKTISVGETAQYRCRHATARFITWKINDTMIEDDNDLPPGITRDLTIEGGGVVFILKIIGRPEYNTTTVVGVAMISNGLNETTSPTAILQVSMNTTVNGFIEEPLSLNVTIGEKATFHCEHLSADAILWRINGTSLSDLTDLHADFIGSYNTLTVTAQPEYNATVVQCVAFFSSNTSRLEVTPDAILLIQGKLDSITNLFRDDSTFSWNPPYSLDLTNVEPEIVYCVDVYNITCGGRELLISDCDVTETSYTSDVIAPDGYIYEYIVTPRSNVEGAINGTPSQPLRDTLPTFTGSSTRLSVGNFGQNFNIRAFQTELTYHSNNPIPSSYSLSLQSLDGLDNMYDVETTATIEPSVLTLEVVSGLPFRRLWNCTVLAYGCKENSILNDVLSTYDFRNISFSSLHPGEVRVTGSFTDDSTATGVLVIVIGDSEVIYHKASRDGTDKIKETLITGLAGGEYSISVFVVEENGLPFERVATSPKLVAVETNDVATPPSSSIEYSLQSTSTGVCITCTFLDSSATDCVAVVHQQISQLSSSGLMNIESSHKLTRSGDTASGCIEGVNMEDYQVGVFGWRQAPPIQDKKESGAASSCKRCIVGSVLGVLLGVVVFILLAVVVVFIVVRKRKRTKLLSHDIERRGAPIPPWYDHVNQPENEATVQYESVTVTNSRESRTELEEVSEPLLSTLSPPLPTRPGENRVDSDSSSDSAPSSQDTIETDLSSPSQSNDDCILGDPGPLYDLPQLPGSTDVPPPTDLQDRSNEEESPPPIPPRTEDRDVLVKQSSNPSPSAQDMTSTNIQSPPDPMYAEPQQPERAPVQTSSEEDQFLQSPPPVPPITQDREVLLQGSPGSSPTQGSPHIAVVMELPPSADPTYAEPQLPAVNQPQSKEKQEVPPSGESCGPTYAQPVLSSGVISPPPATEPVVYEDVKGFKNSEGQHYAMLVDLNTSKKTCTPDDSDKEKTVYSEIQPGSLVPTTAAVSMRPDTGSQKNKPTIERDPPFTGEHIFPRLLSLASKWQAVGKALSLDEDRLDEIFTNNETDEACLRVMLEFYMLRSDLKHNWEEIREAKSKVEEKDGETKGIDSSSLESSGKKPLSAEINDGRVTSEHGQPPAVPPHAPPHTPTGVESASHNNMTTADSTTEECPAPKHVEPHMTCGQPHNDSSDAVVDLVEVDTELEENECREHQQVQNNEEKEEEAAEEESGDNMNTVINKEDLRGTAEIQVSHTHTPPSDFSPQPFDDNKDECKEHQFPLSFQETQHDEADYKTELMKTLKTKTRKEKQNCQENKLSSSNPGQSTIHEAERALSPSESPSPSMVDSQLNTKLHSIFDQYGGIVKKISVHRQVTMIEVCITSQTSCICVCVIFTD